MPSPRFATAPLSPIEASQRLRLQSALLCRLAHHIARMSADLQQTTRHLQVSSWRAIRARSRHPGPCRAFETVC